MTIAFNHQPPVIPPPGADEVGDYLLSVKDVMRLLGVSRTTVYRLLADDSLPKPIKLGLRRIAWRASDLRRYIAMKGNMKGK